METITFDRSTNLYDDDENVKAMRETAQRIRLTGEVVFIASNLATVYRDLAAHDLSSVELGVGVVRGQVENLLELLGITAINLDDPDREAEWMKSMEPYL